MFLFATCLASEFEAQKKSAPQKKSGYSFRHSRFQFRSQKSRNKYFEIPCHSAKIGGSFILNDKAVYLAKPEYPRELKAEGITGSVTVRVVLNEQGKVVSAATFSGHSELRRQALKAVKKSKFKRIIRCGKSIKINGMIIFNFAP